MRITYGNAPQFPLLTPFIALLLIHSNAAAFAPGCKLSDPGTFFPSQWRATNIHNGNRMPSSSLHAVTKKQTLVLDGAELSYYLKCLAQEQESKDPQNNGPSLPNLAPRSPQKRNRVGAITFVTTTLDEDLIHPKGDACKEGVWLEKGTQIMGVQVDSSSLINASGNKSQDVNIISIGEDNMHLYRDSIAVLPSKLSPADAISTASTSLLGVHCSLPSSLPKEEQKEKGKIVIVGGGDYASFLAKALVGLGNQVSMVSARPNWSLPSQNDIAPKKQDKDLIDIMPPAVGQMSLGFAAAIGEFDTIIDTLGDEMGMGRALNVLDNEICASGAFLDQLKELHGCNTYISTLTRSQQYVLKKGLLFARDPVIQYQNEVEKMTSKKYQMLPPPSNFGATIQQLLEKNIIFTSDTNENGSHANKVNFVRGWSLSDLTELKTWPRDGPGRFGFPVVDLSVSSVSLRRKAIVAETKAGGSSENKEERAKQTVEALEPEQSSIIDKHSVSVSGESTNSTQGDYHRTQDHIIFPSNHSEMIITTTKKTSTNTATVKVTKKRPSSKPTIASNPHVTTIHSVSELNTKIIEPKQNSILFLTASYCQKCKRMTPQFNRMARISTESSSSSLSSSDVIFAHVDISSGPRGKQLGKVLGVDKVPSVMVFQNGQRVPIDDDGNYGEEASSSIVIERSNLNRLEDVAKALESGNSNVNVSAMLSAKVTVEK